MHPQLCFIERPRFSEYHSSDDIDSRLREVGTLRSNGLFGVTQDSSRLALPTVYGCVVHRVQLVSISAPSAMLANHGLKTRLTFLSRTRVHCKVEHSNYAVIEKAMEKAESNCN